MEQKNHNNPPSYTTNADETQIISKKIILIGAFSVGKTSLIAKFVYQKFSSVYKTTLGVRIDKKLIEINPQTRINLLIWDLGGETEIQRVPFSYYLGTQGIIYVFDTTRTHYFQNLVDDINFLKEKIPNAPLIIVGNKIDLIENTNFPTFLEQLPITPNFFTSALSGLNVDEMFHHLAKNIYNNL